MNIHEYSTELNLADIIEMFSKRIMDFKMQELEKLKADNVNLNLFQYINIIGGLENPTFSDLAEKLKVSKPAVTVIINKLIQQGIANKQQSSDDKRIYYINLTKKGKEISRTCRLANMNLEKYIKERLTGDEYKELIRLMSKAI